jgi:hypothetical protein
MIADARRWFGGLGWDVLYVTTLLALAFFLFLRSWPLWEDQAIFHYMAWAARHGSVLYRDVINMNWPGCVFVHMLAQSFAGMDASGVRLVEVVFLGFQCLATAAILRSYRAPFPLRAAAITIFVVAYLDGGAQQTAQRESFMTPCLAVALLPLLASSRWESRDGFPKPLGAPLWFVAGAAAAFGASIKPTLCVPLAGAALGTLLSWRGPRRALWERFGAYARGAAAVVVGILGFFVRHGDVRGFYRWAVEFTFGPYARLRYSNAVQIDHAAQILTRPAMAAAMKLCLAGVLGAAIVGFASVPRLLVARRADAASAAEATARTLQLALLVCLVGLTIHLQGKTHCDYHFIPLKWALSLFGAALLGGSLPARVRARLTSLGAARALVAGASFVAGVAFFAASTREHVEPERPKSPRARIAEQLAGAMAPSDTVVIFGFAPSILCALERHTPLPFVDSWILYSGAPEGSGFRRDFVRRWERALADPSVRFFLVESGLRLYTGLRFDPARDELSDAIVREHFPPARLEALGFSPTPAFNGASSGFIVYERAR